MKSERLDDDCGCPTCINEFDVKIKNIQWHIRRVLTSNINRALENISFEAEKIEPFRNVRSCMTDRQTGQIVELKDAGH